MFRLPLCPYCKSRFFYKDVKEMVREREGDCPNCEGRFAVQYIVPKFFLIIVTFALTIILNLFILSSHPSTIWALIIPDAIFLVTAFYLRLFFVRFKK